MERETKWIKTQVGLFNLYKVRSMRILETHNGEFGIYAVYDDGTRDLMTEKSTKEACEIAFNKMAENL